MQQQTLVGTNEQPRKKSFPTGMLMVVCFVYSVVDVTLMDSDDCMVPMQRWLLVSYLNIALFRAAHYIGQEYSNAGQKFVFSFRHSSWMLRVVVGCLWGVLIPFFIVWTVLGTSWFRNALNRTDGCKASLPPSVMVMVWQFLSYIGIALYGAIFVVSVVIELRLRNQERDMLLVETDETRSWWGRLSVEVAETDISILHKKNPGLRPQQIQQLPEMTLGSNCLEQTDELLCAICISEFADGDKVRCLTPCGHHFHKSCVDLWLLRQAECPMCKCKVDPDCKLDHKFRKEEQAVPESQLKAK